jgi:hypothetical protein
LDRHPVPDGFRDRHPDHDPERDAHPDIAATDADARSDPDGDLQLDRRSEPFAHLFADGFTDGSASACAHGRDPGSSHDAGVDRAGDAGSGAGPSTSSRLRAACARDGHAFSDLCAHAGAEADPSDPGGADIRTRSHAKDGPDIPLGADARPGPSWDRTDPAGLASDPDGDSHRPSNLEDSDSVDFADAKDPDPLAKPDQNRRSADADSRAGASAQDTHSGPSPASQGGALPDADPSALPGPDQRRSVPDRTRGHASAQREERFGMHLQRAGALC